MGKENRLSPERPKKNIFILLILPVLCVSGYFASGKDSISMTVSDTCFLVGIVCLTVGIAGVIRKTGFFFISIHGLKQFVSLIANAKKPRRSIGESYEEYLATANKDATLIKPLLIIAFGALGVSAALSFL